MSSAEDIVSLLGRTKFFADLLAGLSKGDIKLFADAFRPMSYKAGQEIFARGDPGNFLFIVAEGRVRLSVMTDEGKELTVRLATSGELIGEIATLDGGPRTASATALIATKIYVLHRPQFRTMLETFPNLALRALEFLCDRLRDTTAQLESIALYPVEVRLARFLLVALAGRTAEPGKRVALDLGFSQTELAQVVGASRPKVNVALGVLEDQGAIRRTSDRLFCDPVLLARIARYADSDE